MGPMERNITISIQRFHPGRDRQPRWVDYEVAAGERTTLLESFMSVYETIDPTLAFRFGCRYDKCGLCAVEVDGKPRMACLTEARDGMKIAPLGKMPLIRDLVIDREVFFHSLRELGLFIPEQPELAEPQVLAVHEARRKLLPCTECLACNATCPHYRFQPAAHFGPYLWVKLALLHLDPRNRVDRKKQAASLGIERCADCAECACIHGIKLRDAIGVLYP